MDNPNLWVGGRSNHVKSRQNNNEQQLWKITVILSVMAPRFTPGNDKITNFFFFISK